MSRGPKTDFTVNGASTLTGDVTFGGHILADQNEAKNIFAAVTMNAITIGGATPSIVTTGELKVGGGYQDSPSPAGGVMALNAGALQMDGASAVIRIGVLTGDALFGGHLKLVAANIGAAVMPWMIYFQQSAVVARRLTGDDVKDRNRANRANRVNLYIYILFV